ncbi:MAG TPA: fumarylacetoacetate hydrolase family protein [Alphaproteobacteria bacterium]|nr:fumarylacetoacetate hydrolase family protein [Alphaproteobacteria bacterium]
MNAQYAGLAERLDKALLTKTAMPQITLAHPELTLAGAYEIQSLLVHRRLQRGERRIGMKMGLTSRAKMLQVGVNEMSWGRLTDAMLLEEGGVMARDAYIHPRLEPELAFLIGKSLSGKVTAAQALSAVDGVAPAMELVDSRYLDFKFTLNDVVADNSSAAGLLIGPWCSPTQDLSNLGVVLEVNGMVIETASTAAILGHPVRALVAAARLAAEAGEVLHPGDIVMSGGLTAAHSISPGETVRATLQNLGFVSINVN